MRDTRRCLQALILKALKIQWGHIYSEVALQLRMHFSRITTFQLTGTGWTCHNTPLAERNDRTFTEPEFFFPFVNMSESQRNVWIMLPIVFPSGNISGKQTTLIHFDLWRRVQKWWFRLPARPGHWFHNRPEEKPEDSIFGYLSGVPEASCDWIEHPTTRW